MWPPRFFSRLPELGVRFGFVPAMAGQHSPVARGPSKASRGSQGQMVVTTDAPGANSVSWATIGREVRAARYNHHYFSSCILVLFV